MDSGPEGAERLKRISDDLNIIDILRTVTNLDELSEITTRWATENGFERWIYGVGAPAVTRVLGNYPEKMMQGFRANNMEFVDPLVLAVKTSRQPLTWDLRDKATLPKEMTARQQETIDTRWELGVRGGITVPVHTSINKATCVLSMSNHESVDVATRNMQEPLTILFSIYFQMALVRILGAEDLQKNRVELSEREIECLKWTAVGKTRSEISTIVGISASTVDYHLLSAAKKLGVKGRTYALVKALSENLIEL